MPDTPPRYCPLRHYAIIGDSGSAALVSIHGSIDWLCWPTFDSPSTFGAILDADDGGTFWIRPRAPYDSTRRYIDNSNVLETMFRTKSGVLRLTDLMPVAPIDAYNEELWPDHQILRIIECVEGSVDVSVMCDPRLDYGRVDPPLSKRGSHGYFYNYGSRLLVARSDLPLEHGGTRGELVAEVRLEAGDRRLFTLAYDSEEPAVVPPLGDHALNKLDVTLRYWKQWSSTMTYDGAYRNAVMRSALALKLMTNAASGAIVAAPTTSLPERIGGVRNWDYRYCWLRDASFTLHALFELGFLEEGSAFFSWLLYTTRRTLPEVSVLYDVHGRNKIPERQLDHLEGYMGSRPVRVGNGAANQLQLDVYGSLVAAAHEFVQRGGHIDRWQSKMLTKLSRTICQRWELADESIWEIRSAPKRHTYSNAMCWVGLDRLLKLHERGEVKIEVEYIRGVAAKIRKTVEERGYNQEIDSYVNVLDGDDVEAALLLLPIYGYIEPNAPRMQSTFERIRERLGANGLLYRYPQTWDDGFSDPEGAFGICSFWAVEYLASAGRLDEAHELFRNVLTYANDAGLYPEQLDPTTGDALGNFPQAFTHVGLINAALAIDRAEGRRSEPGSGERRSHERLQLESTPEVEAEPTEQQAEAKKEVAS
ncbi:MAG: glycoside hydrolase family 15 protein [Myxococcota bacterium]